MASTTQSAVARWESGGVDPGFDTVRRLVRLCGFSLAVGLDRRDDSDLTQARRQLGLSPQRRVDRMVDSANSLAAIRGSLAGTSVG
jgi:hypothetical protein